MSSWVFAYLFIANISLNPRSLCVHMSLPTHEPVSSFDIYLIKILLVPDVVRLLVLKNNLEDT